MTTYGLLLLVLAATALAAPPADMAQTAEAQVLNANTQFSNAMYKSLSKKEGNVFFSPLSAHAVLAMAYQGAAGTTKEAFTNSLHVQDQASAAEGYDSIMQSLNNVQNITLAIANKVYVMDGIPLKKSFEDSVVKKFHSEVDSLDFSKKDESAAAINGWVNEKTREKIPKLFEPDAFSSDTRVVLVNAIYFKGNWEVQFSKEATRTEPFYVDAENKIDAQMMHITKDFLYKQDQALDAKVLEMKYKNSAFSMVVILPNKKDGIADLEAKLADYDLNKITDGMYETEVIVALPKFKIETEIDLKDTLTELGLGEIFDEDKCDLSEMIDNDEKLVVSKAIQKAFIEVNEEGAEAAAATGLVVGLTSASLPPPKPKFYVNHPFVVILKSSHGDSDTALFQGRVSEPKSGDEFIAPRNDNPFDQDVSFRPLNYEFE